MRKKGQAALEFLMTYGWAILVVIAAIGALAYFGVLSPDRFLPEKCTLPSGIVCADHSATTSQITLVIQNSQGFAMSTVSVAVNGTGCDATGTGPVTLANGDTGTYVISCSPAVGKFKGDVLVSFVNQGSGLAHTKVGELIASVQ